MPDVFPVAAALRDRFVLDRRGPRPAHDPWRHQGTVVEEERSADGRRTRMATVFLTGRECPWRCTMCDLWRYTTADDTPPGAIPHQVAAARAEVEAAHGPVQGLKLYNAGSFFDPRAVPDRARFLTSTTTPSLPRSPAFRTSWWSRTRRWSASGVAASIGGWTDWLRMSGRAIARQPSKSRSVSKLRIPTRSIASTSDSP
jgi:hypothetical protein